MDQKQIQDKLERIQREVNQVIRGKENVVERVLAAIISGGHILMEDIPGRWQDNACDNVCKSTVHEL